MTSTTNHRILLVDDNPAIHEDFRKVLVASQQRHPKLENAETTLFELTFSSAGKVGFELESAFQGREALDKVFHAKRSGNPFAMAFIDVRMPPGWDGIETIEHLWKVDPALQIVLCTAYSDYSWDRMTARLGINDSLVILKKPFDHIEVLQLAHTLTRKWNATQQAGLRFEHLDRLVAEKTASLQTTNEKLSLSEERFSKAFRASPVALAIQAQHSERLIDVNAAFIELVGLSRAELVGFTPVESGVQLEFAPEVLDGARAGRTVRSAPARLNVRGGDVREALVSFEQITIAGEVHLLLMVQDVSERLRLETQLRQAQKMEAIGQLAAGIAHDFNNLLTIIEGHASLQLATPGLPRDAADSLRQIEQAAERAAALTRQLLAFSRRQIMHLRVLNLNALIEEIASMLHRLIGEHVTLQCDLSPDLPSICADQTSIEQIVMNLTLNARDAVPKTGNIVIATQAVSVTANESLKNPDARPGDFVCLSVSDTGTGMDAATVARIFEPFFTTKEVNRGTGMGLATVHGIVHQHHGWIEVVTAPGEGSSFRIHLPATHQAAEPASALNHSVPAVRSGFTILVVEDDPAVRALVKEVLTHSHYHVLEADCAEAAVEIWREKQHQIDLVLTDIVMPGSTNGLELAQRLLADQPDLKIIYTSGYSADLIGGGAALVDGSNYLPKPYLSHKLIELLRAALESAPADSSLALS